MTGRVALTHPSQNEGCHFITSVYTHHCAGAKLLTEAYKHTGVSQRLAETLIFAPIQAVVPSHAFACC